MQEGQKELQGRAGSQKTEERGPGEPQQTSQRGEASGSEDTGFQWRDAEIAEFKVLIMADLYYGFIPLS